MKCPRCQSQITAAADATGLVVCSGCGARLRSKSAPAGNAAANPPAAAPPPPARPAETESTPDATRGTAVKAPAGTAEPSALEQILAELRSLREGQQVILNLLQARPGESELEPLFREPAHPAPSMTPSDDDEMPARPPAVRSRRRKTVLVLDDDEATRNEAKAAMEKAEIPVRVVGDGNAGLAAIAKEKPDVIVLELALGGSMGGRDVVNMIKATMEWIDVPIVLYTRLPIENQKEARQIHGADELVHKGPGGAESLVTRVISLFRRA